MKLILFNPSHKVAIENYQLDDLIFSNLPQTMIANHKTHYHPILCFKAEKLVCFFILDEGEDRARYSTNPKSLLLRAFSTDSREVRKGYAYQSLQLLPSFIKTHFPLIDEVLLGVNERNDPAANLYLKAGFIDTKRKYLGPKGYQRIFSLSLS